MCFFDCRQLAWSQAGNCLPPAMAVPPWRACGSGTLERPWRHFGNAKQALSATLPVPAGCGMVDGGVGVWRERAALVGGEQLGADAEGVECVGHGRGLAVF